MKDWSRFIAERPVTDGLPQSGFAVLESFGLIRVAGEDATTFLQGQLTGDVTQVTDHQGQLTAWCNPKGRMLAIFHLFRHQDAYLLLLPRSRLPAILQRLQMFVLRSKVDLAEVEGEVVTGLWGEACHERLPMLPDTPFGTRAMEGLTLMRLPGDPVRCQLVGPPQAQRAFFERYQEALPRASEGAWALLDIRAGLPWIDDATAEAFVPQMCNLDLLGGISFTKGCYTGQEVVARMKYLGQLKRRMYHAQVQASPCPKAGAALFSPSSRSAQGAGKVVMAQPAPQGGCEALVVAEITAFEAGDLHLEGPDGPALTLQPPPYGLETEEEP